VGKRLSQSGLREDFDLTVLRVRRRGSTTFVPSPGTVLEANDCLIVEGDVERVVKQKDGRVLHLYAETKFDGESLAGDDVQLAEVAVAPNSFLLRKSINQGLLRRRHNVLVLALRRRGRTVHEKFTSIPLAVGDVLLVQGAPEAISEMARSPDFLVANRLEHATRETRKAPLVLVIMGIAVTCAAMGLLHISACAGHVLRRGVACHLSHRLHDATRDRHG
jgi:uncharacterized protein with PhoU and TrkA domain